MTSDLYAIASSLESININSRPEMLSEIKKLIANAPYEVIDTHNTSSVIFIFTISAAKYVLKAEYGSSTATEKEIAWYKKVGSLPTVPLCLYSYQGKDFAFLILEYIDNTETMDGLVEKNATTSEEAVSYLQKAIRSEQSLFRNSKPSHLPLEEMDDLYAKKFYRRAQDSKKFAYLDSLLSTPVVTVNKRPLPTPTRYLEKIVNCSALHAYLTPSLAGIIHGDLHCGNILIARNNIYLVDPNGNLRMPIEYDYGKLFHSIHGAYGQIMSKKYKLELTGVNSFMFDFQTPTIYETAFRAIASKMSDQEIARGIYAEALHFATMLPHHASSRYETTALFLRCIQIFDELFNMLSIRVKV